MRRLSPLLADGVQHGFFTREGGVSAGIYASLNCGTGSSDNANNVVENRRRACADLGVTPDKLVTPYQIHSARTVVIDEYLGDEYWKNGDRPEADSLVTRLPGIAIGIVTADCVPVLLHDSTHQVIGALHAGWKGTLGGVVASTIDAMVSIGAARANIAAAIGPCIAQVSYEVGPEIFETFTEQDQKWADHFVPSDRADHYRFDLAGVVHAKLAAQSITNVHQLDHDTYAEDALFFSYRRTTHKNEPDYGRQLSAIVLDG